MAGGTWQAQDKVRPGAYINFQAVERKPGMIGNRGIGAICMPLSWGEQGSLIEVLSTDLADSSKKLIGLTSADAGCKLLDGMLSYCYKALVYRGDTGGSKATVTIGDQETGTLTATARYNGLLGNHIIVAVLEGVSAGLFDVSTYVDGVLEDSQVVAEISELHANDWVEFSGTGDLSLSAGAQLAGGLNGTYTESVAYEAMEALLRTAEWQTLAVPSDTAAIKTSAKNFIKSMRDDEGRYVQCVVADDDTCDYEGFINNVCGCVIDGVTFTPAEFTAIVAGMTAGADVNESNTAREIKGAQSIVNELSDRNIVKGIKKGQFIISTSRSGAIRVEKDINSLHTFTEKKTYPFCKNRVIRTLDQIGTDTVMTWEDSYLGKVDNNATGRAAFKADLIAYGNEANRRNMILDFEGTDITVTQGSDIESVRCDWYIRPVDSMEKLYMTVFVSA